jgi:ElaB/YqjD/DUF883 family membrane-anchored ribosome-binding protein
MENEPELIRDQMQETRTALTEKLDTLQQKVADTVESITTPVTETVQTVKEAVSDTVDSVKETFSDTVDSVKETFNLSRQIEQHPWPIMLGSVAAGFMLGRLLPSPVKTARSVGAGLDTVTAGMSEAAKGHNGIQKAAQREEEPPAKKGMLSGLADAFGGELDKLKGLGVSVGVGLLRDLMAQSAQGEIGGRLKEWMDGLTEKLGGKPLSEPLISPDASEAHSSEETRRESEEQGDARRSSSGKVKSPHEAARRW